MDNLFAFLNMIGLSEGADYNTLYDPAKNGYITDFSDHPGAFGFKDYYNGKPTTASGKYQITYSTWKDLKKSGINLPDFSPTSQDTAATALIQRRGALNLIQNGDIVGAINKLGSEWASLPSSDSGQPKHDLNTVLGWYYSYGGSVPTVDTALTVNTEIGNAYSDEIQDNHKRNKTIIIIVAIGIILACMSYLYYSLQTPSKNGKTN